MIELKLSTSSPYGYGVSACLAILSDQWGRHQYDLRINVEYGFRDTLSVLHGGGEYEIDIEGKTAPEIVGLVTATLQGLMELPRD